METTEARNSRIETIGHQAFLDALDITPELNTVTTVEEALPLWEIAKTRFGLPGEDLAALEKVLQIELKIKAGKKWTAGFPGVVATAAMGRILDPTYMPMTDFYACAPRAIFDANLFFVLEQYNAPTGKSDPLNVTKSIRTLNKQWVAGRRISDQPAAQGVVDLATAIETSDAERVKRILTALCWWYFALGKILGRTAVAAPAGLGAVKQAEILLSMIDEVPDGGATAQLIAGAIAQSRAGIYGAEKTVEGLGESVYGTNTTSGKAGDFIVFNGDNMIVYEVTTKTVNQKRLSESAAAVQAFLERLGDEAPSAVQIVFLCLPSNVDLGTLPVSTEIGGFHIHAIDLHAWSTNTLLELPAASRESIMGTVMDHVQASQNPKLKTAWDGLTAESVNLDA